MLIENTNPDMNQSAHAAAWPAVGDATSAAYGRVRESRTYAVQCDVCSLRHGRPDASRIRAVTNAMVDGWVVVEDGTGTRITHECPACYAGRQRGAAR